MDFGSLLTANALNRFFKSKPPCLEQNTPATGVFLHSHKTSVLQAKQTLQLSNLYLSSDAPHPSCPPIKKGKVMIFTFVYCLPIFSPGPNLGTELTHTVRKRTHVAPQGAASCARQIYAHGALRTRTRVYVRAPRYLLL